MFAIITFGYFDGAKYRKELLRTGGKVAPEQRLYAAMFGSVLLPISLFVCYPSKPLPFIHPSPVRNPH